jgi:hypothetical protein
MSDRSILITLNKILARMDAIEAHLRQEDDELVDIQEASRILGKTPNAIRIMVFNGQINHEHAPQRRGRGYSLRFRRGDLMEFKNRKIDQY